jgi:hypothetical protein
MTTVEPGKALPNKEFAELMAAVLEKGKPFRFQAAGTSMSPFIRCEDIITLSAVQGGIYAGDILAFRQPENGRLAVHRVIAVRHDSFLLRGDNAGSPDGWVPHDRIIGRVGRIEHRGRPVRIGLGWERLPIAWLSRLGLLRPLSITARQLLRPLSRRFFA